MERRSRPAQPLTCSPPPSLRGGLALPWALSRGFRQRPRCVRARDSRSARLESSSITECTAGPGVIGSDNGGVKCLPVTPPDLPPTPPPPRSPGEAQYTRKFRPAAQDQRFQCKRDLQGLDRNQWSRRSRVRARSPRVSSGSGPFASGSFPPEEIKKVFWKNRAQIRRPLRSNEPLLLRRAPSAGSHGRPAVSAGNPGLRSAPDCGSHLSAQLLLVSMAAPPSPGPRGRRPRHQSCSLLVDSTEQNVLSPPWPGDPPPTHALLSN
ncbi:hypothetical protein SKAU_G00314590 [Synaphobranchus kaupii]|uniref:Uncharacterized protein n=1 Tax=Synaphobranchus kaupii TaxID=118154 RepID=A0A9Q1ESB5_SYNKA|nr:hypothetical protein SKAU_G00314590 [Synaphobranchus kaupii]